MNRGWPSRSRLEFLQATLDPVILCTPRFRPAHGPAIAKKIQHSSEELIRVELSAKGNRPRFCRLTPRGRKQLAGEHARWDTSSRAMNLFSNPATQEAE